LAQEGWNNNNSVAFSPRVNHTDQVTATKSEIGWKSILSEPEYVSRRLQSTECRKATVTASSISRFRFQMQLLCPSTPLTGRRYLRSKEMQHNVTPVSTATQSVSRLQTLLSGRQASPSETLLELFRFVFHNFNNIEDTYAYVAWVHEW
jgi:hypothetical protein